MSISTQLARIQASRDTIRTKLVELGLAAPDAQLDALATEISKIANQGAVSVEIKEGTSYTIPAGYHNGSGVIKAITDSEGDAGRYLLQIKTVTPTEEEQVVTSDEGYYGLESVTILPIPDNYVEAGDLVEDLTNGAAAGDVIAGKLFIGAAGTVETGTMVDNAAETIILSGTTVSYTIPAGRHDGTGEVKIVLEDAKTVTPAIIEQVIRPEDGKVLSTVTVAPIPANFKDTSDADVTADKVLEDTVAYGKDGKVVGTMPNNGAVAENLDTTKVEYTIPEGYHNGEGKVTITLDEDKTIVPTKAAQEVTPADGKVLNKVIVEAIPEAYQNVTPVTAGAADVLVGKTIVDAKGAVVTGTMANNGDQTQTINPLDENGTTSVTIPAGYTTGATISLTNDLEDALAAI